MPDRPTGYEPLLTLKPVAPGLWICDGPLISFYGLPFPTRMTLVALDGGGLFVHSPVALSPALLAELRALEPITGPVAHLIAPNWIHYAHIPAWQRAFPEALTHAAPKVEARAAAYGLPLKVDHPLGDAAPEAWAGQLDQLLVRGSDVHQEVVFFHRASRTLILTDLIENFEPHRCPAWTRPMLAVAGTRDPDGKAPLDMRLSFRFGEGGRGMALLRAALEQMLAWQPERLLLAHGRWYPEGGTAELRRAFRWALD
jgi:hypothetical protein